MPTLPERRSAFYGKLRRQRARLRSRVQDIQKDFRPVERLHRVAGPLWHQLRQPATRESGLQLALTIVPFLLRRDPRTRLVLDLALPLVMRYGPGIVAGVREQASNIKCSAVLGRLKDNVLEMRKRLWRKKRVWAEEAYPETMCFV